MVEGAGKVEKEKPRSKNLPWCVRRNPDSLVTMEMLTRDEGGSSTLKGWGPDVSEKDKAGSRDG